MQADVGLIGLAVMGRNLALNLADHGYAVAVYNRTVEKTREFAASPEATSKRVIPCDSLADLVGNIRKPAPIILMIKAGEPVDAEMRRLAPLLQAGDIILDCGNSHYPDTIRRSREMEDLGLHFFGVGVSGGEEGARHGPSIMPGGDPIAFKSVEKMLSDIAAKVDGRSCCAHVGPDGAGHFVKMVHNGIEYADMQLIAEAYYVLKNLVGLDYPAMREVFADWNRGELSSYLIEITADILAASDPDTGKPLCEVILDRAGQKGTGMWTSRTALQLGVPAPTIAEAVFARCLSGLKEERVAASGVLPGPARADVGDGKRLIAAVRDALYAAKICCYAQGFALLAAGGREFGWRLNLGELAMIWRGGCIIRAVFLSRIKDAYDRNADLPNLLLDPYFTGAVSRAQAGWREVVSLTARSGVPAPAFSSALAYYDGYRTGALWANMIQAQRDYFGAHTYERVDKPGVFHTEWTR